jgi:thioredoxin-like negative regulator of GroEL
MLLFKILDNYFEYFKIFIRNTLTDRSYMLLMFLLVLLFITLLLVIYSNYIKDIISKKHVLNSEYVNNVSKQEEILLLYFYTEWCPYCKQSMPEINKFEEYIKGETGSANYNITLTKIDCDKQTTIADKYKIEAYPSIKLIYKNKVYDYDAKPNKANLIQFLETFTHYKST